LRQARARPRFGQVARKYTSFGLIVLLVVMVVVMLLAAKAWKALQPSQPPPAVATDPGKLPDLQELKRATTQHSTEVRDAAAAIDP
jgi:hypothetical protein